VDGFAVRRRSSGLASAIPLSTDRYDQRQVI
jgi:hypothetical protein